MILEEFSGNVEALVVEELHELIFAVTGTGFGTEDAKDGGSLVGGGDWVGVDLRNLTLHPEAIDGIRRNDIILLRFDFGVARSIVWVFFGHFLVFVLLSLVLLNLETLLILILLLLLVKTHGNSTLLVNLHLFFRSHRQHCSR